MSGLLTRITKNHSMRLRPDVSAHHVVFFPGGDVELSRRVEDSLT